MNDQHSSDTNHHAMVKQEVERLLLDTPSFHQLDGTAQAALKDSITKIGGYLAQTASAPNLLASQLAPPDLQSRLGRQPGQGQAAAPTGARGAPPSPGQSTPAGGGSGQGTTGRVGEVARATLNAIDFPNFVASLIHGTFQAIVDASIQQMEAYAELLKNVAKTVDQFMGDNITEATAKDYLADRYDGFLIRDTSSGQPRLRVNPNVSSDGEMPSFFRELGFDSPQELDDRAINEVAVPAARRTLAEQRQQTLATMVLMGINRVIVDDGEITAKLQFHVDASETTSLQFNQTKTTSGNMSGRAGRNLFTANAIMVNTPALNAQSDINVRADLMGQVKVRFRSETFPLERFADSAAIQFINQNAKVPVPQATPGGPPASSAVTTPPALPPPATQPQPAPPVRPPTPTTPATSPQPAAQSLEDEAIVSPEDDPWAPSTTQSTYDDPWAPRR